MSLQLQAVSATRSRGIVIGPVHAEVARGEVLGLIGANGAGKTTLLRLATGLLRPSAGRVLVNGQEVVPGRMPDRCGAMLEEPRFLTSLSGRENLLVAANGVPEQVDLVDEVLETSGLGNAASLSVAKYSQGMRQRLGVARVLLRRPTCLLLDEPINGLDLDGVKWIRTVIRSQAEQGHSVVVSSHILSELETVATKALVLSHGSVVAEGLISELLEEHGDLEQLYFARRT